MPKRGLNLPKEHAVEAPASLFKRVIAFLIDILILDLVIFVPFRKVFSSIIPTGMDFKEILEFIQLKTEEVAWLSILSVMLALLAILYFALFESKLQQSIGKMVMKIYVVSDTKALSFWKAFARALFILPVFPFSLLMVIDPVVALFNREKRRLLEILTKTKTVEAFIYNQQTIGI